jgi:hypothetical protein
VPGIGIEKMDVSSPLQQPHIFVLAGQGNKIGGRIVEALAPHQSVVDVETIPLCGQKLDRPPYNDLAVGRVFHKVQEGLGLPSTGREGSLDGQFIGTVTNHSRVHTVP